jgi:hypothetical protein
MKRSLAAAVVFACALMGYAQAGTPTQQPDQPSAQRPEQTAPPAGTQTPETSPPEQEPSQEVAPPTLPSSPEAQKPIEPGTSEAGNTKKAGASTAKTKAKRHNAKKGDPAETTSPKPETTPSKKVVRNGGTSDPEVQFTPRLSEKQQEDQRQKISDLLTITDNNLQKASQRQLKTSEEEMVQQIRAYMEQAKQASESGDLQRAQNLAAKAHLLSDELIIK